MNATAIIKRLRYAEQLEHSKRRSTRFSPARPTFRAGRGPGREPPYRVVDAGVRRERSITQIASGARESPGGRARLMTGPSGARDESHGTREADQLALDTLLPLAMRTGHSEDAEATCRDGRLSLDWRPVDPAHSRYPPAALLAQVLRVARANVPPGAITAFVRGALRAV